MSYLAFVRRATIMPGMIMNGPNGHPALDLKKFIEENEKKMMEKSLLLESKIINLYAFR